MNILIMSAEELVRYAKPSTPLEHALMDALRLSLYNHENLLEEYTDMEFDKDDLIASLRKHIKELQTRISEK